MLRRRGELGEGRAGCIVSLIIFLAAIFVAWKMIPVKVKAAELRGVIIDEAKSAGTHRDTTIRRVIMTKAMELELPPNEKDLVINRTATRSNQERSTPFRSSFPATSITTTSNKNTRIPSSRKGDSNGAQDCREAEWPLRRSGHFTINQKPETRNQKRKTGGAQQRLRFFILFLVSGFGFLVSVSSWV